MFCCQELVERELIDSEGKDLRRKEIMFQANQQGMKRIDRTAMLQTGEVITGNVLNGIENHHASGKVRLVVVVEVPALGCLKVIGLTSKRITQSGKARMEILDNNNWGWRGRSFIFGERLTRLSRIDVGDHVGWISATDGETLARTFGLTVNWMANDERVAT